MGKWFGRVPAAKLGALGALLHRVGRDVRYVALGPVVIAWYAKARTRA